MNRHERRAAKTRSRGRRPYSHMSGAAKKIFDHMVDIYASALMSDDAFEFKNGLPSLAGMEQGEVRKTLIELLEWGYLKFVMMDDEHWALSMSDPKTGQLVGNPMPLPKAYGESLERPN